MIDRTFMNELASKAPTPGGGGASAYVAALASSLGSMVANLTVGKKKYFEAEADMYIALERLELLRERLIELIDEDAEVFAPLAASYGMPKNTPDEQAAKEDAMQKALIGACDVPLDIMRQCAEVIEVTELLAYKGSRLALSDAGVAAVFAKAALQGASLNIIINIASMSNKVRAAAYRKELDELIKKAGDRADSVFAYVLQEIS